jgi:hypothetical protein
VTGQAYSVEIRIRRVETDDEEKQVQGERIFASLRAHEAGSARAEACRRTRFETVAFRLLAERERQKVGEARRERENGARHDKRVVVSGKMGCVSCPRNRYWSSLLALNVIH